MLTDNATRTYIYDYAYDYDQIVSIGEFLSTKIMGAYLQQIGFDNSILDARDLIKTDNSNTSSSGIGDLIVFPRYNVYNRSANFKRTEIAIGLGLKIPLGAHNDSTVTITESSLGLLDSLMLTSIP